LKLDKNIPTTKHLTEEDILHVLLQTNEPGEIENEDIELEL
jgi:hypothetical protein